MAQGKKTSPSGVAASRHDRFVVERVQTGVRIEKRLLKVLKAFAELRDMSLGDLIEGIVLHAFDNKTPFSTESLKRIASLKEIYGLDLDAFASHQLHENTSPSSLIRKEGRSR
jgi:predicted DNA-binding ribbon-helix-helix protein